MEGNNNQFWKGLGDRIRQSRDQLDISQEDLAVRTGRSQNAVSRIENGEQKVFVYDLLKIAAALEVSPSFLLEGALIADDLDQLIMTEINSRLISDTSKKALLKLVRDFCDYAEAVEGISSTSDQDAEDI